MCEYQQLGIVFIFHHLDPHADGSTHLHNMFSRLRTCVFRRTFHFTPHQNNLFILKTTSKNEMGQFSSRLCLAQVERGSIMWNDFFFQPYYYLSSHAQWSCEEDATKHDISCDKIFILLTYNIYVLSISSN
jgi:hypothetical protein